MSRELSPDLLHVLDSAWLFLQNGIHQAGSRLRTPVLATVDRHCAPDARTVVVERLLSQERKLYFNTDRRSPKFREITIHPQAVFVFHEQEIQIRLRATLILCNDRMARRSWDGLPAHMRALYAAVRSPGSPAPGPTRGLPPGVDAAPPRPPEAGFINYALVEATATHLDWLCISGEGPRRAAFHWDVDGAPGGNWIFP